MFDIFYLGDNPSLQERFPFARQVSDLSEVQPRTIMYWLVEPNITITDWDVFEVRPEPYDQSYEHVYKWNSANYGGVRLLPRGESQGRKEINQVACAKTYDVLRQGDPGDYFDCHPWATHVWCVDPDYKISDTINWAPDVFEPTYIHTFHLRGQLQHKYPDEMGGVRLYPREWQTASYKIHGVLDAAPDYPVLRVSDPSDYSQRDHLDAEYVWLIDRDHQIQDEDIDWVPDVFEDKYIHVFRMPYQLTHKYPMQMGGVRLVPRDWKNLDHKIHKGCPVRDVRYDVFYVEDDEFDADTLSDLAQRSRTEWFWVVDRDYEFNGDLVYVPGEGESEYIHIFKVPGQLEYRYDPTCTEPWDLRCGGVWLVHQDYDFTKKKYQARCPVVYDVFYTSDPKNHHRWSKVARSKMFWVVDSEYTIDVPNYAPARDEQKYSLNFQIPNQLRHRYPQREGGVWLVPTKRPGSDPKYKGNLFVDNKSYPVLMVDDPSDTSVVTQDCWLIDRNYRINQDTIRWAPDDFQKDQIHVFHISGQLSRKYPDKLGGARWVPANHNGKITVHGSLELEVDPYPAYLVDDPTKHEGYSECWLIDREYNLGNKITVIPWQNETERNQIHVYHVNGRLRHKYPESMGGVYWVPKNPDGADINVHQEPIEVGAQTYPVIYVDDPSDTSMVTKDCWLIDKSYRIKEGSFDWAPGDFQKDHIHTFHVPNQLTRKYAGTMGGIRWVPKDHDVSKITTHRELPLDVDPFPAYVVDDPTNHEGYSECWLIDREYHVEPDISVIPWQNEVEREQIHVYHANGRLHDKYPKTGGVYWIPKNPQNANINAHSKELELKPKLYPVYTVDDPTNHEGYSECWLVDREYNLDNKITVTPWQNEVERNQIHVYHVSGRLQHKYPESMGGVYWVPENPQNADINVHQEPIEVGARIYPVIYVDDPNDTSVVTEDCWLVDRSYRINEGSFDWAPGDFQKDHIHTFHVPNQLTRKYVGTMGGVRWVPKDHDVSKITTHRELPLDVDPFPAYLVDDPAKHEGYSECWLIDREYHLEPNIPVIPWQNEIERDQIHVYHANGRLRHKYPKTGGVYWVPKDPIGANINAHTEELELTPRAYPAYLVDDPSDYEGYSECWLIDREYDVEPEILVTPWQNEVEREQIHVYHANGRLYHKYPKTGGVYWVPKDPIGANINAHSEELELTPKIYPTYVVDDPTKHEGYSECWLIDRDYNLEPNISVTPWQNETERTQIHVYHANGRLRHKYPESMGGVYWVPKNPDGADVNVHHEQLQLEPKQYPVHQVADPTNHEGYSECWLIDEDYVLDGTIAWSPEVLEQDQIHVFHIHGQLANKYPDKMGGAYWVPKNPKGAEINVHSDLLSIRTNGYPVYRVENFDRIEDYSECWLVDREYEIGDRIPVIPWQNQIEREQIHVYRVHGQLEHKYPDTMGGAYWIPKDPKSADINVHTEYLPATPRQYPIYFVEDPDQVKGYSECWLIDQDYEIDTEITWVPDLFERDQIHAFHVRGQLDHKYPDAIGGVRWVPKDPNNAKTNIHTEYLPVKSKTYKVVKTKTPADYLETGLRECWLIDEEYEISEDFEWTPGPFERDFVHVFHVPGQLEHKYPESMGGIYWLPKNPVGAEIKIHTDSPFEAPHFEIYQDEEEGRHNTSMEWFWVVDSGVELHDDFSLDFVPDVWDHGKTHVWQKLNPVTGKVYDYGGVKLCPREPKTAGRPKYMRSPACTQREYPVYHIEPQAHTRALQGWYEARAREAQRQGLDAFWVVDTYTQLDPQWEFDFYPTQWDRECVHVFEDDQGRFRSVRWVPVSTFLEAEYTDKEIATNSFPKLKEVRRRASVAPDWPVVQLPELNRDALYDAIRSTQAPFVVTVDPHVDGVLDGVTSFMPEPTDLDRVHIWQRENPRSGKVWGYGGVRLWPTQRDYQDLTSESVRTNRLKGVRYVKSVGARDHAYDIVFISYHEPHAEERYKELSERFPGLLWVKDVDGIFEAHKRAAELASTPMFWVVDGDAEVKEDFGFDYMADPYDRDVVHVWNSFNPVTGDTYGYGGIKLFPTHLVRSATSWGLDFTTGLSSRYKEMPETASTTRINGSAWDAWRSGFREAAKLALKSDSASKKRLEGWLHPVPDAYFRHDAKRGAEEGRAFALANKNKPDELAKINSREFLEEQYGHEI